MTQDDANLHPLARAISNPPAGWEPKEIDVSTPSVARVYDAILGGKDNFPVDRAVAEELVAFVPDGRAAAIYNRAVLGRGVRYLAEQGIRQFIDLGSGLPTARNTHQVAQEIIPDARVAYVDNDPIVLAHGRALLAENQYTTVITADVRQPEEILSHPDLRTLIDFDQPIGLLMLGIIHHLNDDEDPGSLVARYRSALVGGSYLFLTHFVDHGEETEELQKALLTDLGTGRFRTMEEIAAYFDGLELVEPGVVYNPLWRPDGPLPETIRLTEKMIGGGIGRKP
ncbi:SAM-dependent methyltransferase [Parafrankia discariae]|uniref:SAM-dependent methyltransferase n=1 Tax=Parafrankia discariae TaxID=365528 RepID=UPI00036A1ACB|nr:SAM-dependent methyltransferase [Parafrankia discariae]